MRLNRAPTRTVNRQDYALGFWILKRLAQRFVYLQVAVGSGGIDLAVECDEGGVLIQVVGVVLTPP
ncbi:hypothetical protein D3C85_1222530 [compost metagenome]